MKTTKSAKSETIERKWHVIDARGKVLGRLATRVAGLLTGKGKACFTPHVDCGDHVIVINAEHIQVTGKKMTDKMYHRHTGYLGHLKTIDLGTRMKEHPEGVIRDAVRGMVPKSRLGSQIMGKLKVYKGQEHPHAGQQPEAAE